MERENTDTVKVILWIAGIIFFVWLLFFSNNTESERITEDFENGNFIDVEVDRSITSDTWECTSDCSGHNAGYDWASENDIADPSDCGGKSLSFIEGCEAYANENY